ncbi:MAG: hypothetical protein ACRC4N_12885 [Gammaproteobacteria bacterium]
MYIRLISDSKLPIEVSVTVCVCVCVCWLVTDWRPDQSRVYPSPSAYLSC